MHRKLSTMACSTILMLVTSALLMPAGQAADADDPKGSAAKETNKTTATQTTKSKTEKPKPDEGEAKVFIPTEEISEDFAVSFPVDI